MDHDPRLVPQGVEELIAPVRRLLDDDTAEVVAFDVTPLDGPSGNPTTLGLRAVRGTAVGRRGERPFAVVRKVVHDVELPWLPRDGYSAGPQDWNYWKREILAHGSGLLDGVDAPLRPARGLGVEDHGDWAVLWVELVDDAGDDPWSVADLVRSAGALGDLSGLHVAAPPSRREHPWLVADFLPAWVATMRLIGLDRAVQDDAVWRSPDLCGAFPAAPGRRIGELVRDAPELLAAGSALPVTLTHHDAGRRNLFRSRGDAPWRLIDWSFLGVAPVGQELGHALGLNTFHHDVPADPAVLDAYERAAAGAYVDGLRHTGVDVPERAVRGYARAVAALQHATFAAVYVEGLRPEGTTDDDGTTYDTWPRDLAAARGVETEVLLHRWAAVLNWLLDLGDRAREDLDRTH